MLKHEKQKKTLFHLIMNTASRKAVEVNGNCAQIAEELCSVGQFVTTDKILLVLLQRYNIAFFEQLNVGHFYGLPFILTVWELNKKV